jgi:hypothetical protein
MFNSNKEFEYIVEIYASKQCEKSNKKLSFFSVIYFNSDGYILDGDNLEKLKTFLQTEKTHPIK